MLFLVTHIKITRMFCFFLGGWGGIQIGKSGDGNRDLDNEKSMRIANKYIPHHYIHLSENVSHLS